MLCQKKITTGLLPLRENISSGKIEKWLKMEVYYAYKGTKCIFS